MHSLVLLLAKLFGPKLVLSSDLSSFLFHLLNLDDYTEFTDEIIFFVLFDVAGNAEGVEYRQHIMIQGTNGPFSDLGDSGAVVVDQHIRLVGLLRGDVPEVSLVTPWSQIEAHCDVEYKQIDSQKEEL